ncbi:hypothetical protein [Streptomyces sp. NRRL F-5135]|nr:hypothetical protein [Streptomyces sp. NRRL F-5135]
MTISETERPHSQLSRFEDMFPGYGTEMGRLAFDTSELPVDPRHT